MEAIEIGITAYIYESLISKAGDRCVKLSITKGAEPIIIKKQNNIVNRFVRIKTIFLFFLLRKLVNISTPICKPFDNVIAAPKKITQINKKIVISPAQGRAEFNKYLKIEFLDIEDKKVCVIHANKSDKQVFLSIKKEELFYIRIDASSRMIEGQDLVNYCMGRFSVI